MSTDKDSVDAGFNKKYNSKRINSVQGFTKPVCKRILIEHFGDKFISIVVNTENMKFDVFIKASVSDKIYERVKKNWADVFNLYKSDNK